MRYLRNVTQFPIKNRTKGLQVSTTSQHSSPFSMNYQAPPGQPGPDRGSTWCFCLDAVRDCTDDEWGRGRGHESPVL